MTTQNTGNNLMRDLAIIALLSALTLWSAVKLRVRGMKEVNMIDQWRGTELL